MLKLDYICSNYFMHAVTQSTHKLTPVSVTTIAVAHYTNGVWGCPQ